MPHATPDSFASDRGTANFMCLSTGRAVRGKAAYELRHISWADNNQLSASGATAEEVAYTVYVADDSGLNDVRTCLGRSGTLSVPEGSKSAYLASFDASEYVSGGEQLVTLSFVILS